MAKPDLRKLNRAELLELLIAQTERADRLSAELTEAKEQIRTREKLINQAGDLAAAATKLLQTLEIEPVDVRAAAAGNSVDIRAAYASKPTTKPAARPASAATPATKPVNPVAKPAAKAAPATKSVAQAEKPTLTPQQLAVLQKNRDKLTPQQLEMLKKEEAIHYRLARRQAAQGQKPQKTAPPQKKGIKNERKGIDLSAIAAITSGIGAGKI